jgi:antitoxin (DNA-binding transcriptional repressor) of toxin-antitoxin stability system
MKKITATRFRKELFSWLTKVSRGERVTIERDGKEVAMLVPLEGKSWREHIHNRGKILEEDAFAPMDDIWEKYQ